MNTVFLGNRKELVSLLQLTVQKVSIMRRQVSIMRSLLNVHGNIGSLEVPTNPSGNAWNTTHEPLLVGSFGVSGNIDVVTYNGYNMMPPYAR